MQRSVERQEDGCAALQVFLAARTLRSEQRASLLAARTLLGAPGLTTWNKDATSNKGLRTKRSDASRQDCTCKNARGLG